MYFDTRLWQFTKDFRLRIAATVLLGLLSATTGIVRLGLLGWLLAQVFTGAPLADLMQPLALVAGTMVLRGVLEYANAMTAHGTAARIQLRLRQRLYDKVVELGPAHFGMERTGNVLLSVVDGVEQLETYFGRYLPQLFVAGLTPVLVFSCTAFLDLPIAFCLMAFALLTLIAPSAFHYWDRRNSIRRQRAYGAFGSEFLDSLQGLSTLKAFGQSAERGRTLAQKAHELFRTTMWVLATNSLARGITDTGIAVGAAATLALGAWRVESGETSLTVLLVVLMLGVEVFRPLRELRVMLHEGMVGQSAAAGVFAILDAKAPVSDAKAVPLSEPLAPTVEFRNVSFAYPGARRQAHTELDFAVAAGERIGIVGPSGAGKSSIAKLLQRLYDPDAGTILIGGRDIRDLRLADLRRHMAVVHQDTYLFHGTVEDNLRIGKPEASQEELEAAARAANAHDFIRRLPQGYATVVGERGLKLSGGQRQRIAIARALLRDAPILVLDEALSAVDSENEAIIQEALDRLMQGRTTLIFAHRLSSVIGADRILVLGDGRVVEQGRHQELMLQRSAYYALMEKQAQEGTAQDVAIATESRGADAIEPPETTLMQDQEPTDAILQARGMGWGRAIAELMKLVMPWKAKLIWTFLFGVSRVIAYIGVGVVSALAVAAVKQGEPFTGYLWALAVLAPAAGVLHWLESWIAHDMAFRLLAEMRIALFQKLDQLAPAYLLRRRTGDLVSVATQDVEKVEYFFAHTIAPAFVAVLVPAVVLALLLALGWPMALALLPFLAAVALSPLLARDRVDRLGSRAREALGDLNAHAVDTIQGLSEVVAFQQEGERGRALKARGERHISHRLPFFKDLTAQKAFLEAATGLGGTAVVAAGAWLVADGAFEAHYLPLLTLLAMAAFLPVSEIADVGRQLAETLGSTRRLYAVHNEAPAVAEGSGKASAASLSGPAALTLHDVTFSYPGTPRPALQAVDLEVPAGATVALVGPSGAGKSTAAHMLMRFWDPERGSVRLGGRDLRDFRVDDLRDQIALVAQDTYLFNDTLRANIMLARPRADDAELQAAIERAALGDFVAGLPDGLDTMVGERGMRLSGGQRQRVAIARAFLKDAPILILDEATSHLDAVSEDLVRQALDELMADRSTVVIAHRLSTIRNADRIYVLNEGEVAEWGSHTELLARGGLYAHLVSRQLAGAAA